MSLGLDAVERLARARSDLRMGAGIAILGPESGAVVMAAETASAARLAALRGLGAVDLAITDWRAETLKARAYDGDLARVALPADAEIDWVRATANPAADLDWPMKGPYLARRGGSAALHRAAIALLKGAHLLPAALVVPMGRAEAEAVVAANGLSAVERADVPTAPVAPVLVEMAAARVPLAVSEDGRVRVFRPRRSDRAPRGAAARSRTSGCRRDRR